MFSEVIQTKQVRNGLFAYKYRNGVISIDEQKYIMFSMSEAIRIYRNKFPKHPKK